MTESQIQLQNALTTTFLANLVFLSECNKELYYKVDELSQMIENGTYKEKYALEFIMENGDFDIYDIVNDKYLYNKKPKEINDELVKKVQFNENNSISVFGGYSNIINRPKVEREKRFDYVYSTETTLLTTNDLFEYSNILKDSIENNKKRLRKVTKFIFLGTLLGRHIPRIAKKINANIYLVLEKNLEIFRLSLFTIDYSVLAEKGVIFSIMDSNSDEDKIQSFFDKGYLENYLLKFSTTNINVEEYIDKIVASLMLNRPTQYDYNRRLYIHVNRTTKYLNEDYKILQFDKIQKNFNTFKNLPILYIASGPSLEQNLDWIKKNQNKFFIVTIGSTFKKLISNNIKIGMVTTLDEQYATDKQFDDESVSKMDKDTIVLASMITNEEVLQKFNQENVFLYEVFFPYIVNNIPFSGFSIGELTLNILQKMNAKEIYIIGLDLALNQDTGETHSEGSTSMVRKINLDEKQNRDTFHPLKSLIKVKGNLKNEVSTTSVFYNSIRSLLGILSNKDEKINIYNLSQHGAFFENTIPKKIEDIELDNFKEIDKKLNLSSILLKYSISSLTDDSINEIKREISCIENELIEKISELKDIKSTKYEYFHQDIFTLISLISENRLRISSIIQEYYKMMLPPLVYHFNHKNIKNEEKILKEVKKVFIKQIENIVDDYLLCLKRFIK